MHFNLLVAALHNARKATSFQGREGRAAIRYSSSSNSMVLQLQWAINCRVQRRVVKQTAVTCAAARRSKSPIANCNTVCLLHVHTCISLLTGLSSYRWWTASNFSSYWAPNTTKRLHLIQFDNSRCAASRPHLQVIPDRGLCRVVNFPEISGNISKSLEVITSIILYPNSQ